jgi:radical SAM protein with 4Fe4S-binding SPASM domain
MQMKDNIIVPINPTYHELVVNDFAKQWERHKGQKYRQYREKWVRNPKNFILEDAPIHLDIEPTNACNLKCPMCPRTVLLNDSQKSDGFFIGRMDMTTFKRLIDEAARIGVYSVKLNWLGEPLIHPDIVEMVSYAKSREIVDVMFNTNAVLLNKELSKKLIEAGLDRIFFSFDSSKKEKYEQIRMGAKYEETLNNIKAFIEARNELGKNSPLTRVSMIFRKENQDECEDFVNLFQDIVDIIAYIEYRPPLEMVNEGTNKNFGCCQLWQRMFISWNGDCTVCCTDSEKEYLVGNIYKNSIKEIWKNEKYMEIRNNHKSGDWNKTKICRKCMLPYKEQDGTT